MQSLSSNDSADDYDSLIETAELSPREARDAGRDPTIAGSAMAMVFTLHHPFAGNFVEEAVERTWGVEATGAHTSPHDGRDVAVAVLDTGIDRAHKAFVGLNILERDFTGEGNGDQNGHGTHCAGTIFGQTQDGRRIGVAPGVSRILIGKVLNAEGHGATNSILEGMEWAIKQGAQIVSMSLGMDFPGLVDKLRESGIPSKSATSIGLEAYRANVALFEAAIALMRKREFHFQPSVIVAATGNESDRPRFTVGVSPPAAAEGIISVNAVRHSPNGLNVASFSNTNGMVSAPGVDILSAKNGGGFQSLSGTSMAAPHVAGVAALWLDRMTRNKELFNTTTLTARVLASCTVKTMQKGFNLNDIGTGCVQAPQG